jgi:hypothetical protein
MFEIIGKYFWILLILSTVNSAMHLWRSTGAVGEGNVELLAGRRRLTIAYSVLFNIPWLVMGFGILTGRVDTFFQYLQPRSGPPFAMAWIVTTWVVYVPVAAWVLLGDGASVLARHFFAEGEAKSRKVKQHALLAVAVMTAVTVFLLAI